jgi:hypothetical protein
MNPQQNWIESRSTWISNVLPNNSPRRHVNRQEKLRYFSIAYSLLSRNTRNAGNLPAKTS